MNGTCEFHKRYFEKKKSFSLSYGLLSRRRSISSKIPKLDFSDDICYDDKISATTFLLLMLI